MSKKRGLATALGIVAVITLLFGILVAKKQFWAEDYQAMLRWFWLLVFFGISFYPLSACLFQKFSDKGYFFGKVLGIVITGWLVWVLASLHIAKFTAVTGYVVAFICAVVNYGLAIAVCHKKRIRIGQFLGITDGSCVVEKALWYEVLFFAVFSFLLYIKCFRPDFCWTTEGPTNYGFMTSLMKSEYLPPEDAWFSGTTLNYYYFGQYIATYLTKLSEVTVGYGYNLALLMTETICVVGVFSLVVQMFGLYMRERTEEFKRQGKRTVAASPVLQKILPGFAGMVSSVAVTFCASCHYYVYAKLVPIVYEILELGEAPSFWFPDSTRYIGHQGEALDTTIHEFPAYSFTLGDLHAHVVNLIYVLTLLAVLFGWLLQRRERMKGAVAGTLTPVDYKRELLQPNILVLSFLIGIFQMANYWDFPIYFVVCGAVILVSNAVICGFTGQTFLLTFFHAVEFIVLSFATAFLFRLHFDSMANGIGICDRHTTPYQMLIVWGLPILSVIGYLVTNIKEEQQRRKTGLCATEHKNVFFAWLQNLKTSELFLLILGLCAVGLVLMPELVYVRDIYGAANQRSNTMFKLTYQAFLLFGICFGMIVTRYLFLPKNGKQVIAGGLILFLLYRNAGYFETSWRSWAGDYKNPENYKGLDAVSVADLSEADEAAIDWINENVKGRPVILEAVGASFVSGDSRISFMTGCPTVLGWHDHEWLWKNDWQVVHDRAVDVETIYTSTDKKTVQALLEKYDVAYLYVGKLEAKKYIGETGASLLDYDFLKSFGEVVYEDEAKSDYQTFLVKIATE